MLKEFDVNDFDFDFEGEKPESSPFEARSVGEKGEAKIFKALVRVGNRPIVRNLFELFKLKQENLPPDLQLLYQKQDLYTVLHALGTTSQGTEISELVYDAELISPTEGQTVELLPNTKFKEWLSGSLNFDMALTASGNLSAEIPDELKNATNLTTMDLGGGVQMKANSGGGLVGKFAFSFQFPIAQSIGTSSNKCRWVLHPETGKPLIGDQILMQIIAVPKGTRTLKYRIDAEITVKTGMLMFVTKHTQDVLPIEVEIPL